MSRVLAVIPARYAAVRFPGKPLAMIQGKPMVQHVWERCRSAEGVDLAVVATDDERILSACREFGADAVMTDPALPSGTDRVARAAESFGIFEIVLNVQGDEPAIEPSVISYVAALMRTGKAQIGTAVVPSDSTETLDSPHVVKAVVAQDGRALYFSRSVVPFVRNQPPQLVHFRHLGIYGFQRAILNEVVTLSPSPLERTESLEQLRWLEAGYAIHTVSVQSRSVGIDTPEDLNLLIQSLPR
ncbi:MAG: 3-deoxy-manno-octulosonate cytidylyltransferase [Calditrichaeota bacterium]|nr:3-deoxy-manno-octulosonate cytidylyltransferase [Calditrichota bacterium]MCB9366741.1 3-deoxy-manno-octulosonate cytidylyltransferase [Calditrichota bacterium]